MSYIGSWKLNDNITFSVNTHRADTGAATDADAVPTYRVYEDETAAPLTTGSMILFDSANTAGYYTERFQITAAAGYQKGSIYHIYVTATVNSVEGTKSFVFQVEAEVDANVVSDKTGYSITAGGIAPGAFSSAAIDANAIATDAIGAAELASDAVDEIRDAILADSTPFNGADIATIASDVVLIYSDTTVIESDTTDIQTRVPAALVGGRIDANISAINNNNDAAVRLALSAGQIIPFTVDDTAFTPTVTAFEADDITEATADHYNGRIIVWTTGVLAGQMTSVSDYQLSGSNGKFTVVSMTEAPANNDTGVLI